MMDEAKAHDMRALIDKVSRMVEAEMPGAQFLLLVRTPDGDEGTGGNAELDTTQELLENSRRAVRTKMLARILGHILHDIGGDNDQDQDPVH